MDVVRRRLLGGHGPVPARPRPPRPPWALEEAAFLAACRDCSACVAACGLHLIRIDPALGEGRPVMDFTHAGCTLCGDCGRACPGGALQPTPDTPAWDWKVQLTETCLTLQGVVCRSCGEACDAGAIRFRPRIGGPALPALDPAACNGCGACLAPCPSRALVRIPSDLREIP